jgi:hypothetical protein
MQSLFVSFLRGGVGTSDACDACVRAHARRAPWLREPLVCVCARVRALWRRQMPTPRLELELQLGWAPIPRIGSMRGVYGLVKIMLSSLYNLLSIIPTDHLRDGAGCGCVPCAPACTAHLWVAPARELRVLVTPWPGRAVLPIRCAVCLGALRSLALVG